MSKAVSERRLVGNGCLAKGGIRRVEREPVLIRAAGTSQASYGALALCRFLDGFESEV